MSVPEGKRTEGELAVITKARALAMRTISLCSNNKYFSKRRRWLFTGKICELSNSAYALINAANSIYVETTADATERILTWKRALARLSALYAFVDLCPELSQIGLERAASWAGDIKEVQRLVRDRIRSDMKRYKNG